jgi:3-oxoacyl-[acyl-carrier protein] reductase
VKLDFSGQVVAVGGAASAIGQSIANSFHEAGASVFCADRAVLDKWPTLPGPIDKASVNLKEPSEVQNWIEKVEKKSGGPVSILINNAGGVLDQTPVPVEAVTDENWGAIIDANLTTTFNLCRAVARGMKRAGRGVILNIGSGASLRASLTGVQAYCAAKHAVLGITRQLAHEMGPYGVRVNCIAPGFIITNAATRRQWSALGNSGQQSLLNSIALRRLGKPSDIANAVMLMASDYASFVSGEIVSVNGGR